jgi:hypothetical protein
MTMTVPNTARPQKSLRLKIGVKTYQRHVSNVLFSNGTTTISWQGGDPDALLSDTVEGPWTAAITMAQDWENPEALCNLMLANAGEIVEVEYQPHADGVFFIASEITLVSPAIGGPVNQYNEATVTCGASKPRPTFPPAVEPGA